MLHPAWIFILCLVLLVFAVVRWRWPLPLALIGISAVAALLAGFWNPLRHLVEGGFGYLTLILTLFAGAFFGQAMRLSGAADAVAAAICRCCRGRSFAIAFIAGALLFLVGMFVGIAGVSVLAAGVFAVPMLRRIGMVETRIAAFLAVIATCGMVAPPINVPAMTIADGVNMPFADFSGPLLLLSVPSAVFTLWYFARGLPVSSPPQNLAIERPVGLGFASLIFVFGFWTLLRLFPETIADPAIPIVLVVGALIALPGIGRGRWNSLLTESFQGMPLRLAAILVAVGVTVQIMALTGVRGWLVINVMSFPQPWTLIGVLGLPALGSVLTSIGTANVLGVPIAFAYIHQDMIINVSAISALAGLAEFTPPTAIAAVLASYLVGGPSLTQVIRASWVPLLVFTLIALLMLIFATELAPWIVIRSA